MMLKTALIFFFLFKSCLICAQEENILHGEILEKEKLNDIVSLVPGLFFSEKYFENKILKTKITNGEFYLDFNVDYPQMYTLSLNSEKNAGMFRLDFLFIDDKTTEISFDSNYRLKSSNGYTNKEFLEKFMPYISTDDKLSFHFYDYNEHFDEKLYNYINENPDSYVALWFLIGRFNKEGYTELYEKSLNSFSEKIKSEILWKIAEAEFSNLSIKTGQKFPEILLKDVNLKSEVLQIPKAEYTLIDFWFSRCRPCLEELPEWIDLYEKYKFYGLNIIGISTDKAENVKPYWQKRIVEKKIPWKNYLDENAVFATKEKIFSFPTNYLLNNKGEIIRKNIRPEELEKLLIESSNIQTYFDYYDRRSLVPVKLY